MTLEEIYNLKVKYLKDTYGVSEEDKVLALAEATQKVKNFCHRTDIPTGLYFTLANIARDLLVFWYFNLYPQEVEGVGGFENLDPARVKKISVGDTAVELSGTTATGTGGFSRTKAVDEEIDTFLRNYLVDLRIYRKLIHSGTYYG